MKTQNMAGKSFVLLLILLGALAILAYFYSTAGGKLPFEQKPYKVTALLTDSQQVLKHADVRASGVKVGEVGDISNTPDNKVRMVLEIKKKYAPVYRNAKLLVRQKTLVGENYVDLDPGSAQAGRVPDGGTLTVAAQKESVPIDKVLNALNPKTRKAVSKDLQAAGESLDGRGGDLNELFDRIAPVSEDGSALLGVLNKQRGQITRLVQNTGTLMGAIANRTNDLGSLVRAAKTTSEAVAARDEAVGTTFRSLPPTLRQARTTVNNLTKFSGTATPVVNDLRTSLQSLRPVLTRLRPTAARARRLTDALPKLFKRTNPTLTTLPTFANSTTAMVPKLEGLLRQTNPTLAYLAPYKRELTSLTENFSSGYTFSPLGVTARCSCPFGVNSFANFPGTARQLLAPLLDKNSIAGQFASEDINVYRKPGALPDVSNPAQNWQHVEPDTTPNKVIK